MKVNWKKLTGGFVRMWRRETLAYIVIFSLFFIILSFVTNIPNQASTTEVRVAENVQSLTSIYEQPVNAPYKLLSYASTSITPSVRAIRAVSFTIYLIACIAMYYALKHWHTAQASILTTLAFAANSIVLATSRLGEPLITVMSLFIFSSLLLWQVHSRSNKFVPIIVLIALAALLYTPGAVWFLTIIGLVYWNRYKHMFKNVSRNAVIVGSLLSILVTTPLVLGFIRDPASLNQWLLLPDKLVWSEVPRSILRVPSAFIYRMPEAPIINIARLPVFDIASGIFFLIGLNAYRQKLRLDRTRIMIGSAIVGIITGALGQLLFAVVMLLPFAYSVIAAGVEYLLDEWYSVFPKNPLARSFGFLVVTSVVLFSMYYQLTRFFVVWPQYENTRETYNQSLIIYEPSSPDTIVEEKGDI